jgi:hypothetical protein
MQYPNSQPRRGIHPALIVLGVLAFIPFFGIAFLVAGLSSLGASNGDSGARNIVLAGAILVAACIACISSVVLKRRGNAATTPSTGLTVGADTPPPPPVAAPAATRAPAARLISIALGTLAATVLISFALIGLSIVAELAGVSLTPFIAVGGAAAAIAGVYRLTTHRRHRDSE